MTLCASQFRAPPLPQDLQDFLDLYYEACSVLRTEEDFHDLMYAYLMRASADNVYMAEIFFDPQTHTDRGVPFDTVISGLYRGILDGYRDFSIRASLIMCFLRHLSEDAAISTLEQARPHLGKIIGVGLDSGELGNPPTKFERVFKMAAELGLKLVAHAGEEGGPEYIREALDVLHVSRIDHGVQCLKDPQLVERLVRERMPLTTCPLSNVKLEVNSRFFDGKNITGELLSKGLKVTINSDDPAYFGGYIGSNFLCSVSDCNLSEVDVYQMCRNAFTASFLSDIDRAHYLTELDHFTIAFGYAAPSRAVSMFGSRKPQPGSSEYEEARAVSKLLASRGYSVLTGGYGGIMQACSHGAKEGLESAQAAGGNSLGQVHGVLAPGIFMQRNILGNGYLTQRSFARSLTDRIYRLLRQAEYFVVFGGTIGTMGELFVVWNAASLRMMYGARPHRIFVWRSKWEKPLEEFADALGMFSDDRSLIRYVSSAEELLRLVEEDMEERKATATIAIPPSS